MIWLHDVQDQDYFLLLATGISVNALKFHMAGRREGERTGCPLPLRTCHLIVHETEYNHMAA